MIVVSSISYCHSCPRHCAVDRAAGQLGLCGAPSAFRVARIAPHMWEEPPISGVRGSGTVFFSGCSLRCVFCQNRVISHEGNGRALTVEALAERIAAKRAADAKKVLEKDAAVAAEFNK